MHATLRTTAAYLLFTLMLWGFAPQQAHSQIQIGAGLAVSRHTNGYLGNYRAGAGLDLRFRYIFKERFALGLNTGYYSHGHNGNNKHYYYRYGYLPFMIAGDVLFPVVDKLNVYAGLEFGAMLFSSTFYDRDWDGGRVYRSSATHPGLGIETGVQYSVTDALYLYGNLGVRAAFYNNYWGRGNGSLGIVHFAIGLGVNL